MKEQLREAIRRSGRTLTDVSSASGVNLPGLSRFMSGKRGLSLNAVDALFRALRLEVVTKAPSQD